MDRANAELQAMLSLVQGNHAQTVRELVAVTKLCLLPDLQASPRLQECLLRLYGTTTLEALYIIDGLTKTQHLDGDVCEFGVANGRTSALIATTLVERPSEKRLWLFDSFEGLPAPSEKDVLIDDVFKLGSMAAYKGHMSSTEDFVRHEVGATGFPEPRVEICKGWVEDLLKAGRHPSAVSFAYLDMDFYQSTADALIMLAKRMPPGGVIVVDDYGFFSSGVKTAVEETIRDYPNTFSVAHPFGMKFAILRRM